MAEQKEGFLDPTGTYPREDYFFSPSLNQAARGVKINELYYGGSYVNVDLELLPLISSVYPKNQVQETVSGHVIELDDTPGNERVLIKHNTGAGVEMRTDGTVIISSTNNKIEVTGGDQKVIVEGNGQLVYNGNLNLKVSGDMSVEVGGNYNLVTGTKREVVDGPAVSEINGNYQFNVNGNAASMVTGIVSNTYLSDFTNAVKGNQINFVEKSISMRSGDNIGISAEDEINLSSDNMNLGANDISVFGVTGTIGGDDIVFYGEGANFDAGVTAPTFTGDLTGRADEAIASDTAIYASYGGGPGSPAGWTNTHVDTPTTVKPTTSILSDYLTNSSRGIFQVLIDVGNVLKNGIDRTVANGQISNKKLNTNQVRSKLKDPANFNNDVFTNNAIANGRLSSSFRNPTAPSINRTVKAPTPTAKYGASFIGNSTGVPKSKRFKGTDKIDLKFYPDPNYEPSNNYFISSATKLQRGITIAKFLGGYGDRITFNHIRELVERREIARNLYVHAEIINMIAKSPKEFKDYRLIVAEGLYRPGANETVTSGSVNNLRETGRAIVYELINLNGSVDVLKTFDAASYLSDIAPFEELILHYDTFNPNGRLHAQIIIKLPEIPYDYNVRFLRNVKTFFNGQEQVSGELVEYKL